MGHTGMSKDKPRMELEAPRSSAVFVGIAGRVTTRRSILRAHARVRASVQARGADGPRVGVVRQRT